MQSTVQQPFNCKTLVKDLATQTLNETSLIMQQIGMLNLRINDMMTQLNTVVRLLMDENASLKKEDADLKAKQQVSRP